MSFFRSIIKYIWPQIKKYERAFWSIIVFFSARIVVDAIIRPVYFKKIIDVLSLSDGNHALISHDVFKLVFIIIGLNIVVLLMARSIKFLYLTFGINMV